MVLGDPIVVPAGMIFPGMARIHLHSIWARIAVERAGCAADARVEAERTYGDGTATEAMRTEFDASLTAVVAVAFALEAWKALLVEGYDAPEHRWSPRGPSGNYNAGHWVVGTVTNALGIDGVRWRDDVVEVFDLRSAAVHHKPVFKVPAWHPVGYGTAVEQVAYRADVARDAVRALMGVYDGCATSTAIPAVQEEVVYLLTLPEIAAGRTL